jgi:hypothetical protein
MQNHGEENTTGLSPLSSRVRNLLFRQQTGEQSNMKLVMLQVDLQNHWIDGRDKQFCT